MDSPQAAIDRALAVAAHDVTGAARTLFAYLFDSKRLAQDQQNALSAIAERATGMQPGTAPAGGATAEALGDNWFQCRTAPRCGKASPPRARRAARRSR